MTLFVQIIWLLIIINTIGALITVFRRPRSIPSIFAWMMVLIFLPGIGFLIYLFLGRGIDKKTVERFKVERAHTPKEIAEAIESSNEKFSDLNISPQEKSLVRYFSKMETTAPSRGNKVSLFFDGEAKFSGLFEDMRQAKDNINVEYYAFFDEKIGRQFLDILIEKAKAGVEVHLLYDPWGGQTKASLFKDLEAAGGEVLPFITGDNPIRNARLNYHLHRKIVIIDGRIGWTGGFNVGDQYIYGSEKFGFWRDTHGRIEGTAAFILQEIFMHDWNVSIKKDSQHLDYHERFFNLPDFDNPEELGDVGVQIVGDGPANEAEILRTGFIKMVMDAEDYIWIQSPYLVPDDSMITALLAAAASGVDVRIMIPDMPDHPFIFRATQYYANYLHKYGVKIYNYNNGFIHAKTMVMDGKIGVFGTTNQDIRSYSLNFEVSAFCFDEGIAKQLAEQFERDMIVSTELTTQMIESQSRWLTFKQHFSRLLSPVL
jgi:Phosphatidylserine/phosphatidylglycerophosphate/cardiolipin synthases and related enzymes